MSRLPDLIGLFLGWAFLLAVSLWLGGSSAYFARDAFSRGEPIAAAFGAVFVAFAIFALILSIATTAGAIEVAREIVAERREETR